MSDVPSNLIPTRLTQLPVAPVADENSLMMIVYQGNNYQIRVGDLLSVAGVPTSTQVIAGTGMTGGGALTGNVTLSIANGGVGSVQLAASGVTSGVYGDATNIPVFTVDSTGRVTAATTIPATISGYVPTSTQVIAGNGLTGGGALSGNVTLAASYSASAPESGFQTGSAGVANTVARSDHKHPAVDLSADDEVDNILGLGNGGTARSLVPAAGAIVWSGADGLYIGPVGIAGQVLVSGGAGAPSWGSALLVIDQPANVVYAGPAAGAAAPTAFRALVNADLPASGVSANTYGSTTAIPVITVNAKGVITGVTTAAITGGLVYQGSWNASTNTPTLTSSVGTNGYYYVVSVAGSTNLNGITDWQVGDWAIYNGTAWQKIDQTNLVSSVNGQVGVVSIAYADLAGSIPTWNQNTTGTAAGLSATLAIASGGSGQTTAQAAMNAFAGAVTSGSYLRGNGTNVVMNTIQVADVPTLNQNTTGTAANVTGTVAIANGGTGQTTAAAAITALTGTQTSAYYLRSNGTNATLSALSAADLTGTVAIASGGTGQTTASAAFNALSPITTTGDLILGNGTNSATRLGIGANGYLLSSNGTTASWQPAPAGGVTTFAGGTTGLTPASATSGAITLAGTLATTNGGTGLTSFTANGIPYASSTSALATGSALTFDGTNLSTTGQVISTKTGSATDATGQVYLNGSTSNRVEWNTQGTGAPAFTTRSGGTKLLIYPAISGSQVDYAMGIDAATLWSSVPVASSSFFFKWYGGQTQVASMDGTGAFTATSFAGAGTGLTGTASSLSIGGNAATATSATSATTATNLAGGAASQIPYQTGSGATTFLANGTAGQVLTSAGASAPAWGGISGGTF
jgi:hypothetical protein